MKKIIIAGLLVLAFIISLLFIAGNNKTSVNELKKIRVAEVTHSIFYSPQYLAIEEGYFEEEGLDIELILTPGVIGFYVCSKL